MKRLVLLVPELFDLPHSDLKEHTPLEKASTPTLDAWLETARLFKTSFSDLSREKVWLELLGFDSKQTALSQSALLVYEKRHPFYPKEQSYCVDFRIQGEGHLSHLLSEQELQYLCEELNQAFKNQVTFLPLSDSKGVCILHEDLGGAIKTSIQNHHFCEVFDAFLANHPFNAMRQDLEEPLCSQLYFHTPGSPLSAVTSKQWMQQFYVLSHSPQVRGLARLLTIQTTPYPKSSKLDYYDSLINELESLLNKHSTVFVECPEIEESTRLKKLLEKIKRIEFMDRHFFEKLQKKAKEGQFEIWLSTFSTREAKEPLAYWMMPQASISEKKTQEAFSEKAKKQFERSLPLFQFSKRYFYGP